MALVVEDGTGMLTAESFTSVSFCDTYHASRGNAGWADLSVDQKEQALRRSTTFLDRTYRYKGLKKEGRDQALEWPRSWVTDSDGYAVEGDSVPREIQQACAEVALIEGLTPGTMAPTYEPNAVVQSQKVGPISQTFDTSSNVPSGARPVILIVQDLIGDLINNTAGSSMSGQAVRV